MKAMDDIPNIKIIESSESSLGEIHMGALCFASGTSIDNSDDNGFLSSFSLETKPCAASWLGVPLDESQHRSKVWIAKDTRLG